MELPQWHHRPQVKQKGVLDQDAFLRVADQFISLANDRNKKILATELHFALSMQRPATQPMLVKMLLILKSRITGLPI